MSKVFDTINFLKSYEKFPCLWDKYNPDFRNRRKRDEAEEKMLPISKFSTVKELRTKIRSIRGTYNQEVAKINKSMKNKRENLYKPKLNWFEYADRFLRKNYEDDVECKSDLTLTLLDNGYDTTELYQVIHSHEEHSSTNEKSQLTFNTPSKRTFQEENVSKSEEKKLRKINNSLDEAVKALKEIATPRPVNEFKIFGQHIATQLAQLPLEEALQLQEEFQRMLTTARLRHIRNTSETYIPSSTSLMFSMNSNIQNSVQSTITFKSEEEF